VEDKPQVTIYIETSLHGPAVRTGVGEWYVEYIRKNGAPETRNGILVRENTTENALALELLKDALSILKKTCSVRVNTGCEHILNVMNHHWLSGWEKAGWVNAKGKPVKNRYLWQQCAELMGNHAVSFEKGEHSYRKEMQWELEKKLRQFLEEQKQEKR